MLTSDSMSQDWIALIIFIKNYYFWSKNDNEVAFDVKYHNKQHIFFKADLKICISMTSYNIIGSLIIVIYIYPNYENTQVTESIIFIFKVNLNSLRNKNIFII